MNDLIINMKNHISKWLYTWEKYEDSARVNLAKLRRCIGKKPGDVPQIWHILFACNEKIEDEENSSQEINPLTDKNAIRASMITLTMYALHQQGNMPKDKNMNSKENSLGKAVAMLINPDNSNEESVRRRFNTLATASDIDECAWHLKSIIQLLQRDEIPINYVQLSEDLYKFQKRDQREQVKLKWGMDFYREIYMQNKQEENIDE